MKNLVIEHGVPIPARRSSGKQSVSLLRQMAVGDSFAIPKSESTSLNSQIQRLKPKKFIRRQEGDNMRFWRTI